MLQVLATVPPRLANPTSEASLFLNREVSWLDFNQRVLELALDNTVPLLERVRYLAIFSSNLDEFFMKRVGGLQRQRAAKVSERSIDGLTPQEQLDAIRARVTPMLDAHVNCWLNDLKPELEKQGVFIREYEALSEQDRAAADQFFQRNIFPILTPLAVDPGHPFPFISNLSTSEGVMLEHPIRKDRLFVRMKLPDSISRWIPLAEKNNFVSLEQVIEANLSQLFPGMNIVEKHAFRVTRNADIELDAEDADDLLQAVEQELRARRMAHVVRIELPCAMSEEMRDFIIRGMEVDERDVYLTRGPVEMTSLFALANLDLPELKFKPWASQTPARLINPEADMFSVIRAGDLLVHHPYEGFAETVEHFIGSAVLDPKVLAIKMTLYRTTSDSPFVLSLIQAAESGKQVAVLIEVKARFDEQRNLRLAHTLETAGVHVVYGVMGLKTHTKLAMVVREEPDGLRTYCHIGTGNYNSRTAQLYTDLGLFTCRPEIAADVTDLFHYLTGRSLKRDYRKLLVAPVNMRERFVAKIRREAETARSGKPASITAKMNALQDSKIINELYEASKAGVKIELFVRGFCCLKPGITGLSENIRVVSILGRFLEHSRIYHFLNGGNEEFYIGSADWMNRNLDYRVEAITPIEDPLLRERLREILDIMHCDRGHAWELQPDGVWKRLTPAEGGTPGGTHMTLMSRTMRQAKRAKPGR